MPETIIIDVNALSDYRQEAMCRTIINSINNLLKDERNRADFEQWKKNKKGEFKNESHHQVRQARQREEGQGRRRQDADEPRRAVSLERRYAAHDPL